MGGGQFHNSWQRYRLLSVIVLGGLFIVFMLISAVSLRQNNLTMLDLREKVFTADREGGDVNAALIDLQAHVTSHMNTALPKLGDQKAIQLKHTYDRQAAAEEKRVSAARVRINNEATAYCESIYGSSALPARAACVRSYIAERPISERPVPPELYSLDFASPRWSPDTAGITLVITFLLGLALLIRLLIGRATRRSFQ